MKAVALLLCFVALAAASEPRFQEVEAEAESSLHRPSMMSESGYAAFKREEADKAIAALHLDGSHESVLDMAIPHINTDEIDALTAGAADTELISIAEDAEDEAEDEADDESEDESEASDEAEDTIEEVDALDADIEADIDAAFLQIGAMESSNDFAEGEAEDAAMESDAAENENAATEFSADADAAESTTGAEGENENEAHEFSADTADEEEAIDETASSAPVMDAEAEQAAAAAMIENESADVPVYDVDPKPMFGMAPQWNAVAPAFLEIADEDEAEDEAEDESEDEDEADEEAEEESEDAALLEVADEEADEDESEDEDEAEDESEDEAEDEVLLEEGAAPAYISPVLVPGRPNKYNDAMPDATYDKTAESALFPGWEKEARNEHLRAAGKKVVKGKGKKGGKKPRPAAKGRKSRKSRKSRKARKSRKSRRAGKKARRAGKKSRRGGRKGRRSGRKGRKGGKKARLSRKYRKGGRRYKLALKRNRARRAALKKNVGGIKAAQKKRDEDLKAQIIAAHDTLSVHDDHEVKYPMDTTAAKAALEKKKCAKGKSPKPNPAPMPTPAPAL